MPIALKTKPDEDLSKIGVHLTIDEVAERLGVSTESARALVKAGLRSARTDSAKRRKVFY